MESAPRLSVVMPCYDVARWLPRCLDETLAALPPDGELLAVDDGSHDATLAILQDRSKADSRLTVIAAPHGGVSAARNRALDVARGTYVFFVDPDDGVEPDFFSALTAALDRDGADCCICGYAERADGSNACGSAIALKGDYRLGTNAEIVAKFLPRIFGYSFDDIRAWYAGKLLFADRELAYSWRMAFRRATIEAAHVRFDPSLELNEDALFNAEFLLAAQAMTCVDRPLYRMTLRDSGAVRTIYADGLRYCRNKLAMLKKREALDRRAGGRLRPLYAGTCVLSVLEILSHVAKRRLPAGEGLRLLRAYLVEPPVRAAVKDFPLSVRRPCVAVAVLLLRILL